MEIATLLKYLPLIHDMPAPWKWITSALIGVGLVSLFLAFLMIILSPKRTQTSKCEEITITFSNNTMAVLSCIDNVYTPPDGDPLRYKVLSIYQGFSWSFADSDLFLDVSEGKISLERFDELVLSAPEIVERFSTVDTLVAIGLSSGAPKGLEVSKHLTLASERANNLGDRILRRTVKPKGEAKKTIYSCSFGYNESPTEENTTEELLQRTIIILGVERRITSEKLKALMAAELPKLGSDLVISPQEYSLFPDELSCRSH